MDSAARTRQLRIALQRYEYAVGKLPCPGAFASIHGLFRELCDHRFHIPHKSWLNAYELAAVTNYIAMFGTERRNHKPLFAFDKPLNTFKNLWKLAEENNPYSDNPAYIAAFILRIVYQQLPYVIHPDRIPSMFCRMVHLFSTGPMDAFMKRKLGVEGKEFLNAVRLLFERFWHFPMYEEKALARVAAKDTIDRVLTFLCATRGQRLAFHRNRLAVETPSEKPYEVNSLLRYPIIRDSSNLSCSLPPGSWSDMLLRVDCFFDSATRTRANSTNRSWSPPNYTSRTL